MALTYFHFNWARTTAGGTHPDWRRDPQAGGGDGVDASGVPGIVHLGEYRRVAHDFEGIRLRDFTSLDPSKELRRVVQVPIGVAATTYLVVYLESGAYLFRNLGANAIKGRVKLAGVGYETDPVRANRLGLSPWGDYFASGANTKFSAEETANVSDPLGATSYTVGDLPGGTDNVFHHLQLENAEVRRLWVPSTGKITKVGLSTVTAAVNLSIEKAG